jgi:hypothetical protein
LAAVVTHFVVNHIFIITHAHKNHIHETTWAANLAGSAFGDVAVAAILIDKIIIKVAPSHIRI